MLDRAGNRSILCTGRENPGRIMRSKAAIGPRKGVRSRVKEGKETN
jgi:hypothetical protein